MGASNSAIADSTAYFESNLRAIEFDIDEDEVDFIKGGVAALIAYITADVEEQHKDELAKIKNDWAESVRTQIKSDQKGNHQELREQLTDTKLINVGSFYEGAKNYYPDKFDFIFVIGTFEVTGMPLVSLFLEIEGNEFLSRFQDLFTNQILSEHSEYIYRSSKRYLIIDSAIVIPKKTTSSIKLRFNYKNQIGNMFEVRVNLSPAFKINDQNLTEEVLRTNNICSSIPNFNFHVVKTASYVITNFSKLSLAEAEREFMKVILSEHHRTVLRLVKHLINGRGNTYKQLKAFCKGCIHNVAISSRQIKIEMIAHHFACKGEFQTGDFKSVHACASEIILDLGFQVETCRKRSIVKYRIASDKESADVNVWHNTWAETPESNEFRNFGSDYLKILGNSLNPGLMTSLYYRFCNIDKDYSQYMIDNKSTFFLHYTPSFFEADGLKWYFSVGAIND